jgi:hypothetical protein
VVFLRLLIFNTLLILDTTEIEVLYGFQVSGFTWNSDVYS